jgi:prepilin peptidase CpaA
MTISGLAASFAVLLFPLAMVYAGVMDLVTMKIRNVLVLAIGTGWLILAPLAGFTVTELGLNIALALLVFAITFTFFVLGWIGGGDAKLAAVTALWFDPQQALAYFTYASLLGGLLTLAIIQFRTMMLPSVLVRVPWIMQLHGKKAGVPYGAAMAPAALIVFPETAWVAHAAF